MSQKQRLFIYDRKEMGILVLLGAMVALFAFTLGIHLGKQVGGKTSLTAPEDAKPVATLPDQVPDKNELNEQGKGVAQAVDQTLTHSLKEEVERTGVALQTPRQIELPKQTSLVPHGRYTLQVGAFSSLEEAQSKIEKLQTVGIKTLLKSVDLEQKGRWYRLYTGDYPTVEAAKEAGSQYQVKKMIDSFIVSNKVN